MNLTNLNQNIELCGTTPGSCCLNKTRKTKLLWMVSQGKDFENPNAVLLSKSLARVTFSDLSPKQPKQKFRNQNRLCSANHRIAAGNISQQLPIVHGR